MYVERDKTQKSYRDLKKHPITQEELDNIQIKEDTIKQTRDLTKGGIQDFLDSLEAQKVRLEYQIGLVKEILNTHKEN